MRKGWLVGVFCTVAALCIAPNCRADLTGTTVTGSLQFNGGGPNFYDPAKLFVPATGYQNSKGAQDSSTITILGGGNDFGFNDGSNLDVTSFSGTGFTYTDTCLLPCPGNSSIPGNGPTTLSFTDSAFTGVTLISSTFGGLTVGIAGDVITINIPGAPTGYPGDAASYTASFSTSPGAVPEPNSLSLMLIGLGAMGLMLVMRKRNARGLTQAA